MSTFLLLVADKGEQLVQVLGCRLLLACSTEDERLAGATVWKRGLLPRVGGRRSYSIAAVVYAPAPQPQVSGWADQSSVEGRTGETLATGESRGGLGPLALGYRETNPSGKSSRTVRDTLLLTPRPAVLGPQAMVATLLGYPTPLRLGREPNRATVGRSPML